MLPSSLFVYGTLMAPLVVETLIGRVPPFNEARLRGYVRHPVKGFMFPGMIPAASSSTSSASTDSSSTSSYVQGKVYYELTEKELHRLDWFEGNEYERKMESVEIIHSNDDDNNDEKGNQVPCLFYQWSNPVSELDTTKSWDYDNFVQNNLQQYLQTTVQPCRVELDKAEQKEQI